MAKNKKYTAKTRNLGKQVFIVSLGCPKNFVDTEVMAGSLLQSGQFSLTFNQAEADVMLINTCAFLPSARQETYDTIKEAVAWKQRRPQNRKIVVAGCLIQWDKEQNFKTDFPEVDVWNGIDGVSNIAEVLTGGHAEVRNFADSPCYIYNENTARLQLTLPHVAYLKVSDGCDNRCSYCSIPNIRGKLRSRTLESCLKEADNLLSSGVKEIVLIAQDITAYGQDNDRGDTLAKLLTELDKRPGKFWIRLLYTHPAHYTDELIAVMQKSTHVVPYVDIPLQHIADNILLRMGRKATKADVMTVLTKLRQAMPDIAIRTTFITGFPGETEADFNELKELITDFKFERFGVFAYAAEPRTPAALMPNQIAGELAEQRATELMEIQRKISLAHNQSLIGKTLTVLLDEADGKNGAGRAYLDAPEIDNYIFVHSTCNLNAGEFYQVEITDAEEYDLHGTVN